VGALPFTKLTDCSEYPGTKSLYFGAWINSIQRSGWAWLGSLFSVIPMECNDFRSLRSARPSILRARRTGGEAEIALQQDCPSLQLNDIRCGGSFAAECEYDRNA